MRSAFLVVVIRSGFKNLSLSSFIIGLCNGERDIDALVEQARERVIKTGELTRTEVDELTRAVRRDLEEFAMSYEESLKEESDSVFMRVWYMP